MKKAKTEKTVKPITHRFSDDSYRKIMEQKIIDLENALCELSIQKEEHNGENMEE